MITGVRDVYYNVSDMERAVAFYRDVLGMVVVHGDDWWTSLRCGSVTVGLHGTQGKPVPPVPADAHGAHTGGTLSLSTDDFEADRNRLADAGTKFLGESENPWGRVLIFEDPDGNILKLMTPAPS